MLVLKTKSGATRATLATLDQAVLVERTLARLVQVSNGQSFDVKTKVQNKSHTKASQAYGSEGFTYRHTFRSLTGVVVNGDLLYPQVTIVDRTFSGASLKVFVGFYRLICSNGLTVKAGAARELSIPHRMSSVEQLRELDIAIAAAWQSVTEAQAVLERAANTLVQPRLVIDALQIVGYSPAQRERLAANLPYARPQDNVHTVYGLYNFINEMDRRTARQGSTAYLDRDTELLDTILAMAA